MFRLDSHISFYIVQMSNFIFFIAQDNTNLKEQKYFVCVFYPAPFEGWEPSTSK